MVRPPSRLFWLADTLFVVACFLLGLKTQTWVVLTTVGAAAVCPKVCRFRKEVVGFMILIIEGVLWIRGRHYDILTLWSISSSVEICRCQDQGLPPPNSCRLNIRIDFHDWFQTVLKSSSFYLSDVGLMGSKESCRACCCFCRELVDLELFLCWQTIHTPD